MKLNSNTFHFISAALVAVIGSVAAFHWTAVVDAKTAAEIVVGLGTVKSVIALLSGDSTDASNP